MRAFGSYGSRNLVLLGVLVVLLLFVGAAVSVRSRAATSAAAVRAAASAASASRYGSSLGSSAVRAADASASYGSSLRGMAAVRSVDQAANASSSLRVGDGSQGLSSLELRRAASNRLVRREPGVAPGR